ncbi:hypothetical protein [Prochlorococcus sp. MIT 1223]|uniref:hypothetical protein n=1 Tax=Prochlorococcus sp. MIT 1223 TaxID=3096217 RepID=UPI002A74FC69|nr:hypothetical protein [Prochlorococcus sp. MIT 1223]
MIYLFLYTSIIALIWFTYRFGWLESIKIILSVLIPSVLIIAFNVKVGRLLFKSPIVGFLSILPSTFFIYRWSQNLVGLIHSWIDQKANEDKDSANVVEAEVISKEDA